MIDVSHGKVCFWQISLQNSERAAEWIQIVVLIIYLWDTFLAMQVVFKTSVHSTEIHKNKSLGKCNYHIVITSISILHVNQYFRIYRHKCLRLLRIMDLRVDVWHWYLQLKKFSKYHLNTWLPCFTSYLWDIIYLFGSFLVLYKTDRWVVLPVG